MALALRYPISSLVILFALVATAAAFTVARPRFHPAVEVENVDLAAQLYRSEADVRKAFADAGIRSTHAIRGAGLNATWFGIGSPPWDAKALYVMVFPGKGVLGLGHGDWEDEAYEQRVGNVLVHYGGDDPHVLEQTKAAVAALRPVVPARGAGLLVG